MLPRGDAWSTVGPTQESAPYRLSLRCAAPSAGERHRSRLSRIREPPTKCERTHQPDTQEATAGVAAMTRASPRHSTRPRRASRSPGTGVSRRARVRWSAHLAVHRTVDERKARCAVRLVGRGAVEVAVRLGGADEKAVIRLVVRHAGR